jgi:hypothetical protein
VYEAIPNFFGLLQLVALRELIDSFADGPEGDKSYAYLMCWLLLIGQAAEGEHACLDLADNSHCRRYRLVSYSHQSRNQADHQAARELPPASTCSNGSRFNGEQ